MLCDLATLYYSIRCISCGCDDIDMYYVVYVLHFCFVCLLPQLHVIYFTIYFVHYQLLQFVELLSQILLSHSLVNIGHYSLMLTYHVKLVLIVLYIDSTVNSHTLSLSTLCLVSTVAFILNLDIAF